MGGRRLVRVRDAGDGLAPSPCATSWPCRRRRASSLLEAGDLPGGSSLRRLVEDAAPRAALPCYRDEERDLAGLVRALLGRARARADPDAFAHLVANLGGDRAVTRAEIAKLALYLADAPGAAR